MFAWLIATALSQSTPVPWADLVGEYRQLGLPIPPADAIVAYHSSGSGSINSEKYQQFKLVVAVKSREGLWRDLDDNREVDLKGSRSQWMVLAPGKEPLEGLKKKAGRIGTLEGGPLFSIQAVLLGRSELAESVRVEDNRRRYWGVRRYGTPPEDRRAKLAYFAWQYRCRRFADERGDRRSIVGRLEGLLAARWKIDDPVRRTILADMRRTLEPRPVPADPHHAAIERLLDLNVEYFQTRERVRGGDRWGSHSRRRVVNDTEAIARGGLDSVPALLDHAEDFRLTRTYLADADYPSAARNVRVADLVASVLWSMAPDEDFAYEVRDGQGRGVIIDRAHVLDWLGRAKAKGERETFLAQVFPKDDSSSPISFEHLRVIADKYPDDFRRILGRILQRLDSNEHLEEVLAVLRESSQPLAEKVSILKETANTSNKSQRSTALSALVRTDREAGVPLVVAELDAVDDKVGDIPLHRLTLAVGEVNDPRLWDALERTAKRLAPRLRVGILLGVAARNRNPAAVPFWSKFLSDEAKAEYRGPCSSDQIVFYIVRHLATEKIALAWQWDMPTLTSEEQWDELRKKVQTELDRRRGGSK